jgi:FtsP/CotA-like multicopper oxidase with cupredoxin domain
MAHSYLMNRRAFLLGAAGAAVTSLAPLPWARALAASPISLTAGRRTLEVKGRAASVFGIAQPDGVSGVNLDPGARFRVDFLNKSGEKTIIHWHGQKPPYLQDGFPDKNRPLIEDGALKSYDYVATPGTHWMHSHQGLQEQAFMAAPLVVRTAEDVKADVQEVTIILHDFTFRDPAEILAGLTGGAASGMAGMAGMEKKGEAAGAAMKMDAPMAPMADSAMTMAMPSDGAKPVQMPKDSGKIMPANDLNDVEYDAFLANDRTLDDPLVVRVERNGRVRLRIINAGASTAFWIDLGGANATLVAVDGNGVVPVPGTRFPMSMAQRLDLMVDVPAGGVVPVFAQVEGKTERTGIILASPGAQIEKIADLAAAAAPPLDLSLEMQLRATEPLADRPADQVVSLALTGSMEKYVWSLNDKTWPNVDRPVVRKGQRIVIEIKNRTMMAHPMHLHGHAFQVIALNGTSLKGALRDTALVPPDASVSIAFDADNPGRWPIHCHNLYHMETGMITEVVYDTFV